MSAEYYAITELNEAWGLCLSVPSCPLIAPELVMARQISVMGREDEATARPKYAPDLAQSLQSAVPARDTHEPLV